MLDRCIVEVRTLSHLLHPPLLEEMGLDSAVPWYTQGFTQRSGIVIDLHKEDFPERLPAALEVAIFRVLQESLTNIHRHSASKRAWIDLLVKNDAVVLRVRDEGKGFAGNGDARSGVGIASMRERVRELGGELRVVSSGQGTLIEATLPLHSAKTDLAKP